MFERIDNGGLKPWHIVLFWVLALAAGAFLGAVAMPHLTQLAGTDVFDMRMMGYNQHDAVAILAALGEEGKRYYLGTQHVVDFFFPPLLFLAVTSLFLWLTRPGARFAVPLPEGVRLVVVALSLIGFVCDWGENLVSLVMTLGDGNPPDALVRLGSLFTVVKTFGMVLALAALLVTIVVAIIRGLTAQEPARA